MNIARDESTTERIYVVIDENGDGTYNTGEAYTSITASSIAPSATFPASNTSDLDGTFQVYASEAPDRSSIDISNTSPDTITIDGSAPYISDVSVTNPSGQDVHISFTTNEQLNETAVALSGEESATFDRSDFSETNDSGTYTYEHTYAGSSDGDYTAEVTRATDDVGNDAAVNQTSSELTDSVSIDTTPPGITGVEAEVGNDTVVVTFNESAETTHGNDLVAANFTYGDTETENATAVSSVSHTAGSTTATLTLDAAVSQSDLGSDTVAADPGEISDGAGNTAPTDGVVLTDTVYPSAPTGATAGVINASNDENYDLTVELPDDHEAGTLTVSLSDAAATATASQYVASEDDTDGDPDQVTFTGLDVSGLGDGMLTVDATLEDDGGNAATGTGLTSPEKDADRPGVVSATITNATIGTEDAGIEQTVTVEFDENLDTSVTPNVTITGTDLTQTYDVASSGFVDGDNSTWEGTVTIQDDNEAATATIRVENATDEVGNVQTPNPDESNTFEVDTRGPVAPTDVLAGNVTASNTTSYEATVVLVDGSQADTVEVRVSDGTDAVTANASTGGSDTVTVTGIDASALDEGPVTVRAQALDDGYANAEGFVQPVDVTKDTARPSVTSVTVGDGTVDDADAGTSHQVTVEFDEDIDQTADLTVTLTGLAQGDTTVSGSFDGPQTWTGSVTVVDNDEETTGTVEVSGVVDPVGNLQDPDPDTSGSVTVDTDTPTVTNFAATHTGSGTVQVSFDSDEALTGGVSVSLDTPSGSTETLTPTTSDGSATYTYTATYDGADGGYTATLDVAEDPVGNDAADGQNDAATVDTTAPTFGSGEPTGTVATNQSEITLAVSDTTRDVNASSIEVTVEDTDGVVLDNVTTSKTGVSYTGTTLTVNTSDADVSLADGTVTVEVAANDTVDNRGNTTFSFDVDTTAPTFTNATPAGTTETDDTRTVSVDVADAGIGVDASSLAVTISNGTDTVLADNGTDTDGVDFDSGSGNLTVDPTQSGVPALPNGTVTVNVSAADAVGNTDTTEFSFTLDTPPEISGFSAADTATDDRNVTVSFESTDDLSTVAVNISGAESASLSLADFTKTAVAGGFEYTATYEGSTDGTYDVTLQTASDGVTDAASGQTDSALVDEAAPDVTVTAPRGGDELYAGNDTVTIEWTATDNVTVTDDVLVEYSTDSGTSWSTVASGLADDGSYDWTVPDDDTSKALVRVNASDNSSNTGSDVSDATFEIDSTAPTVSDVAVSNPSGQNVNVSLNATEPLATLSVGVENATTRTLTRGNFTETGSGPYTYEATFNDSTDGFYDATVTSAVDSAGNDGATDENATVEVDTVTPTISNVSVANPSGQTVNVSFDSSEPLATTEADLETPTTTTTLDAFTETETGSGNYMYYETYSESEDGQYNVTLTTADDGEGNDGADNQTETVVVDTTPPTLSNVSVTNPTGRQVRVHFDANEPIDVVAVDITGAETATVQTDNPSVVDGSYVLTYTGNNDGDYTATISKAVDAYGNDAANPSGTVNVTTAKPVISGFAASNPEAQNVTVTFGSDEALADIVVSLSGAETATLTETNFTQSGDTYTATYEGSSNGTYTAVLETAADANGDDGASGQTNSVTVGSTEPAGPAISGFSLDNPSDRVLRVSFDADATLADVGVAITGADAAALTATDFQVSGDTYAANVTVDADGEYTATLFEAADSSGADGADGQSATATVDTTASESDGDDDSGDAGASSGGGGASLSSSPGSPPVPPGPTVSVTTTGTESASVAVQDADAGSEVTIALDNGTRGPVDVTGLRVTTGESMDYSLSVSSSTDPAPGAPDFGGRAVGHVEVTHSFDDADVAGATMTVRVAADRFADAGVDPRDASVYRHHDGDWQRLDTAVLARTDDAVVLEADTPGFSSFAVGVRDADAVRVSGASVTASAASVGDTVPVSVTLENDASWRASVTLTVTANGSTAATKRVSVPAEESSTVPVDVVFDVPGDYRLTVGDTTAGTLAVRASADDAAASTTTEAASATDGSTGSGDSTSSDDATTESDATTDTDDSTPASSTALDSGASSGGTVPGPGPVGALAAVLVAAVVALRDT